MKALLYSQSSTTNTVTRSSVHSLLIPPDVSSTLPQRATTNFNLAPVLLPRLVVLSLTVFLPWSSNPTLGCCSPLYVASSIVVRLQSNLPLMSDASSRLQSTSSLTKKLIIFSPLTLFFIYRDSTALAFEAIPFPTLQRSLELPDIIELKSSDTDPHYSILFVCMLYTIDDKWHSLGCTSSRIV
jgi:hypothetical protein